MEQFPTDKLSDLPIYYILGIGRSGTTLLSSLLNMHPQVWATPEILFLSFFYHSINSQANWKEQISPLIKRYFDDIPPLESLGWSFDKQALEKLLDQTDPRLPSIDFFKQLYLLFKPIEVPKQIENINLILDKNPSYTLQWHRLAVIDPKNEPRFIAMVRDYRANILSRKQSPDRRLPNTVLDAYRWLFYNRRIWRALSHQKHQKYFLLISYEKLVADAETTLKKTCAFIGIDYADDLFNFHKREENIYQKHAQNPPFQKERYDKKQQDLSRPINASRVEAWRTELSLDDRMIAEYICGKLGKKFGYETTLSIGFWQRIRLFFVTFIPFLKAFYDICKDDILFYVSPKIKLKRLDAIKKEERKKTSPPSS